MSNNHELQEVASAYSQQKQQTVHVQEPDANDNNSHISESLKIEGSEKQVSTYQSLKPLNQKIIPQVFVDRLKVVEQDIKQQQLERNNQCNKEHILTSTKKLKTGNVRQKQQNIKIYDLNEQENNQVLVKANIQNQQNVQVTSNFFTNQNTQQRYEKEEKITPNLFLESKQKQQCQSPVLKQNNGIQISSSQLMKDAEHLRSNNKKYISQKLQGINARLRKGLFYEHDNQEQKQEYQIGYAESRAPMDSGLQIISQMSSRDQLSTRHILSQVPSQQKLGRKKLPSLKPYHEIASQTKHIVKLPLKKEKSQSDQNQNIFQNFRFGKFAIRSEQITDVYNFVKNPIPVGKMIECKIKRNKSCGKVCFLDYDLLTIDQKFLISTKKMALKWNSTYNISVMSGSYNEGDEYYLGKVEGNFLGSLFNIYSQNSSTHEKEIVATIYYRMKCFCSENKFRQIEIYLKNESCLFNQLEGFDRENNLKDLFDIGENKSTAKIRKFINKPPKWNPQTEVYSQDFHGKLRMASVKNMIIIDEANPREYLLLVAKQAPNEFAFDISHPFSPFLALGILTTSFDFKLASQ